MQDDLKLEAYHYHLPEKHIAQYPTEKRDHSRLLVLNRNSGAVEHLHFHQIDSLFSPGDLLVVNDTRVFPARLHGRKQSGGKAEIFLLSYPAEQTAAQPCPGSSFRCEALIKSSRQPTVGSKIIIDEQNHAVLLENRGRGTWLIELRLSGKAGLNSLLERSGDVPLPPYIKRNERASEIDRQRYQTIYADQPGAVAAPTAGLHFTEDLLGRLKNKGVETASITLHVGYGTFAPVQEDDIANHRIHREYVHLSNNTAERVNKAKSRGGRIWAVGTTTVRALEFAADGAGQVTPVNDWCDLYITPGFTFRVVDNLITNFHLPRSSLLFLVSALCGRQTLLDSYQTAIEHDYRFYSYGDAMAIVG